jgi:hypothetical protein
MTCLTVITFTLLPQKLQKPKATAVNQTKAERDEPKSENQMRA